MSTEKRFTELPTVTSAQLTDVICAVQGYVSPSNLGLTVQETLQQVYNLFQANIVLFNAGNPNGTIAGTTYKFCWDTTNLDLYICTASGTAATAVWTKVDDANNAVSSIIGTAAQVLANGTSGIPQTGNITLTLPQNIGPTSSPTFSDLTLTNGQIKDIDGNIVAQFLPNTPADVNYVGIVGNQAGDPPGLSSRGSDAEIPFSISSKGDRPVWLLTQAITQPPLIIYNGPSSQHSTQFFFANTAVNQSITFQDASGTVAFVSDIPSNSVNIQTFDVSGTYTPTAGMTHCIIECIGGGGAGGGTNTAATSTGAAAGGGGSGGYSRGLFTAADIGSSKSVVVGSAGLGVSGSNGGDGGQSGVLPLIFAEGGFGAPAAATVSASINFTGGLGATIPAGSFIKFPGNDGGAGFFFSGAGVSSGNGGSSAFSGGARGLYFTVSINNAGFPAFQNSGAGGSGAVVYDITGTALPGGNGGSGRVIITEFITS